MPLAALDAYLAQKLTPQLDGHLSLQTRRDWSQPAGQPPAPTNPPCLVLTLDTGAVDGLTLRERPARALLAVALLKDRNGVIDLNLPISGSLDTRSSALPASSVGCPVTCG